MQRIKEKKEERSKALQKIKTKKEGKKKKKLSLFSKTFAIFSFAKDGGI